MYGHHKVQCGGCHETVCSAQRQIWRWTARDGLERILCIDCVFDAVIYMRARLNHDKDARTTKAKNF